MNIISEFSITFVIANPEKSCTSQMILSFNEMYISYHKLDLLNFSFSAVK